MDDCVDRQDEGCLNDVRIDKKIDGEIKGK
jgi:hypothetical protein